MFKLSANPTFKTAVDITVPGQSKPATIEVEFRHLSKSKLKDFYDELKNSDDGDLAHLMKVMVGWSGVDTPFSEEALDELLDNYPAAARELFAAFSSEMFESKRKN